MLTHDDPYQLVQAESQYSEHSNAAACGTPESLIEDATISADEPMMPTVQPEPRALHAVETPDVG